MTANAADSTDRGVRRHELVLPGPALALAGVLEVDPVNLEQDGLPLLWHWLFLLDRPREDDLGVDGHPYRNVIPEPPGTGMRRMWAGGEVRQLRPLRVGAEAVRHTSVESVVEKDGRSGRLTFVTMRHRISQYDRLAIDERQDLVYRQSSPEVAVPSAEATTLPVKTADDEWSIDVTPTLLFRFSALTYNAHRIHYDRHYATSVEGYPGLLTHGPLQAIAMTEGSRRLGISLSGAVIFSYRLLSPLFDHQGLVVGAVENEDGVRTWARDVSGRKTAEGWVAPLQ